MKLNVGAGPNSPYQPLRGWLSNDVNKFEGVQIVGPCWDLKNLADETITEIMAKGVLEHLTYREVEMAFIEWRRLLKRGCYVTFDVPDLNQYREVYLGKMGQKGLDHAEASGNSRADGEPNDIGAISGKDRWLRRALYGWQRWPGDEHRSGWTENLVRWYVETYFSKQLEIRIHSDSFDTDNPDSIIRGVWVRVWKE